MNSSHRKIVACILLIMLGINFSTAIAGTVNRCASQAGCCCDGIQGAIHEPIPAGDSARHGCCSSSGNTSCNLNENYMPDSQVFIVSSVRENLREAEGLITFVIGEPSFFQTFRENGTTNQFWITTGPIPIYLQNLTLIC